MLSENNKIIIYIILLSYIVVKFIQKKPIKIIKNKLDIYIILLITSTAIPIIANTYVSLFGTIQTILQYICVLAIYIIIREIFSKDKQILKTMITSTIIIVTVIIVIIGLDGISSNAFTNILKDLGIRNIENSENRMASLLGNSNILGVFLASVLFLNINEYLKQNKKEIKAIYKTITQIIITGIILTYSKGLFLVVAIILPIYILTIKNKKHRQEIVQNILISTIISIIYVILFEKLESDKDYISIWIMFAITNLIAYIINILIENLQITEKEIKSIKLISLFMGISLITYVIIGLNIYGQYEVFKKDVEGDYGAKIIDKIKASTPYTFEFEIEAKSPEDIEENYSINLIQRNNRNQEIDNTQIKFGTYEGTKKIEIVTKETTSEIKIEFRSKYSYSQKKLTIKSLKINQKETPLEYKLLPTKLVKKISNININYKTAQERIEMIKNAMKLIEEHPLLGQGGEAWKCKYIEVQNYDYISNKLHSYPAKVMLEFGTIGIISYISIIVITIGLVAKLCKEKRTNELTILFAFLILNIHSIIDMSMDYMAILIYNFILLGMISSNMHNNEKKTKVSYFSNLVLAFILCGSIYLTANSGIYNKNAQIDKLRLEMNGLVNVSQEYRDSKKIIGDQYEELLKYERYNYLIIYNEIINNYLKADCDIEKIEKYYEKIEQYDKVNKNIPQSILQKIRVSESIVKAMGKQEKYNQLIYKFNNIILNEYEETKRQLEECIVNQKLDGQEYIEELNNIFERAKQVDERYISGVRIYNSSEVSINKEELENVKIEPAEQILLYHTHATESYKSDEKYETYEFYKSTDENYNVIKVGEYLKELLLQKGVTAIHNKEYHNYPIKTETYAKSRECVENILNDNRNINKIIDIHRDAYSDVEHTAKTVEIEGKKVAPLRFVIGINKEDNNWIYDLKWAVEIQKKAEEKYPGLFEPILVREEQYNQDLSKYAVLIEVGENCNYIEEALNSIEYFSEILSQ